MAFFVLNNHRVKFSLPLAIRLTNVSFIIVSFFLLIKMWMTAQSGRTS
jgi:hypothetical protein